MQCMYHELISEKLLNCDQDKKLTNCFFFDGASYVKTAGALLFATNPPVLFFHGREHLKPIFLVFAL